MALQSAERFLFPVSVVALPRRRRMRQDRTGGGGGIASGLGGARVYVSHLARRTKYTPSHRPTPPLSLHSYRLTYVWARHPYGLRRGIASLV